MSIGNRLKSERERLGHSQPSFAMVAGTTKQTLFSWEMGKTAPDAAQLAALYAAGADVLYIVTGQRSQPIEPTAALPPRVAALVDNYLHTSAEGQRAIERVALLEAEHTTAVKHKRA